MVEKDVKTGEVRKEILKRLGMKESEVPKCSFAKTKSDKGL